MVVLEEDMLFPPFPSGGLDVLLLWEPRIREAEISSSYSQGAEGPGKLHPPNPNLLFVARGLDGHWAQKISLWSWASIVPPTPQQVSALSWLGG